MACDGRTFPQFKRLDSMPQYPSSRGVTMDWTTTLSAIVAIGLAVYLAATLLMPERFS